MKNVVALVLGGGRGTRLYPLTKFRAKPAVPLAAKYRLIDIPMSNCIHSGVNRVYVITQFMSVSLHRHIRRTYRFDDFTGGFVEVLAAQQTMDAGTDWYEGTADAVRKNIRYLQQPGIEYVLILSGDQLYRMDYREMLATHREMNADASIAALPVSRQDASSLGIMRTNDSGRVTGFVEKPKTPEELETVVLPPGWLEQRGVESRGRECLASMGIYLFNRDLLVDILQSTDVEDFGREVFPQSIDQKHVQMHLFDDYWEDIGTIKAFYDANLSLVQRNPPFELASPDAPVYTRARFLPPTRIDGATVRSSLIADGCTIGEGATIENSIIGLRCMIGPGVTIRDSILMGADYYENEFELSTDRTEGIPPIGVGEGSSIERAIIDKNCHIGKNVRIVNQSSTQDTDDDSVCVVRDGITIVTKMGVLPDGWRMNG
jgi:glucose-1-phosphate adenylyltransferase